VAQPPLETYANAIPLENYHSKTKILTFSQVWTSEYQKVSPQLVGDSAHTATCIPSCRKYCYDKIKCGAALTTTEFYSFANTGLMKELAKSGLYEVTHKESEEMKAKDEEKRAMAAKMLAKNEPIDKIVEYTGLKKASVEKMKRELEK
jgi:hypothetical protein